MYFVLCSCPTFIGKNWIQLQFAFCWTFCIYLNQFYGTVFTFLWSPVHFWRKEVWSFEAAVTFPVRSVLGLVVYLSSPRHDIRPTAAATFPKTNSCSDCNIPIPHVHWTLRTISIKCWHPATKIHTSPSGKPSMSDFRVGIEYLSQTGERGGVLCNPKS